MRPLDWFFQTKLFAEYADSFCFIDVRVIHFMVVATWWPYKYSICNSSKQRDSSNGHTLHISKPKRWLLQHILRLLFEESSCSQKVQVCALDYHVPKRA